MSDCHSSARCDTDQMVVFEDGLTEIMTVHNVHQMRSTDLIKSDEHYEGFIKREQRGRVPVQRPKDEEIWTVGR